MTHTEAQHVVDAHVHLWDPRVLRYPWLDAVPAIQRQFLPEQLRLDGTCREWVVVQAETHPDDAMAEARWIDTLAASETAIRGMVARAPVELGRAVRPTVERLRESPLTAGVRRVIQDHGPGFATAKAFVEGVRIVGEFGLPFDICVRPKEREDVALLVDSCPDVTFVLDHLGKPDVAGGEWEPWCAQISALAERPNIVCKLSGLTSEAGAGWREADVIPYLRHALESFGAQRCMFGSDWPVATITTEYARWMDVVTEAVNGSPQSDVDAVFGGTARRVYARHDG